MAGITRRLRPYDFRHKFATYLLQNNADLKSTSEMLGHTRTDTTTRIYQHTSVDRHAAAIKLLPSLKIDFKKVAGNYGKIKKDRGISEDLL